MNSSTQCFPGKVVIGNKSLFQSVGCTSSKLNNGCKSSSYSYEETIAALNGLQSNAALLAASEKTLDVAIRNQRLAPKLLQCVGIQDKELNNLKIIHIAGTKGKGSTCALTECILRNCGYKTGFYSSPHLISVTERIRINGEPIKEDLFVNYFWEVYTKVMHLQGENSNMPPYFHFLTILAFKVFVKENVDVAIIEVGMGGEYDFTNIIKVPAVVGITSIGIDHVNILGDTLEKIAWQKAGILKKDVAAYTVPQEPGVLKVFLERAREKQCSIELSPAVSSFKDEQGNKLILGMPGQVQQINASLALQLSYAWLCHHKHPNDQKSSKQSTFQNGISNTHPLVINYAKTFPVPKPFTKALLESKWAGRFQTIHKNSVVYFLDGAHTPESISWCADWFMDSSCKEAKLVNNDIYKVLIFNCTRGRKPEIMLSPLIESIFDLAIFSTNHVTKDMHASSDQTNLTVDPDVEYQQCLKNYNMWNYLQNSLLDEKRVNDGGKSVNSDSACPSVIFDCLTDVVDWLNQGRDDGFQVNSMLSDFPKPHQKLLKAKQLQILVTGSLHLVGGVLKVLESKYNDKF